MALAITADPSGFQKGCQAAALSAHDMGGKITGAMGNIRSSFAVMAAHPLGALFIAAGIAATTAVGALTHLVHAGGRAAEAQAKLQTQFGLSGDSAAAFYVQARLLGLEMDNLGPALRIVMGRIGQAEHGGAVGEALHRIGLEAETLHGMDAAEVIGRVGDALNSVSSNAERAQLAYAIMGRRGLELDRMLRAGSQGMTDAASRANELGLNLGKAAIEYAKMEKAIAGAQHDLEMRGEGFGQWWAREWQDIRMGWTTVQVWLLDGQVGVDRLARQVRGRHHVPLEGEAGAPPSQKATEQFINTLEHLIDAEHALGASHAEQHLAGMRREIEHLSAMPNTAMLVQTLNEQLDRLRALTRQQGAEDFLRGLAQANTMLTMTIGPHETAAWHAYWNAVLDDDGFAIAQTAAHAADLANAMHAFAHESETPLDRLQTRLQQINWAFAEGVVSLEQQEELIIAVGAEFERHSQHRENRLAAGHEVGSTALVSALNTRDTTSERPLERMREELELQREIQRQHLQVGQQLLDAMRNNRIGAGGGDPVIANIP